MGDILYGIDFKNKKRCAQVETGLSLDTPPEVLLALYESQIGFINIPPYQAPEKDPA